MQTTVSNVILTSFSVILLFVKMVEQKDIKDSCFLKMSMYLFNIFKESKDNDQIISILTYSDKTYTPTCKLLHFLKSISFCYYMPSNGFLFLPKYSIDQNKSYILMFGIDQNFQHVAILHKKFKIFIFIVSTLTLLFLQDTFDWNIPLGRDFSTM